MTGPADLYKYKGLLLPWKVRGLDTWAETGSSWHDGDTFNALVSQGSRGYRLTRVRAAGYNAPEVHGPSKATGIVATAYARTLVDTGSVVFLDSLAFEPDEEDNFGRMLAEVTLTDGRDLAELMIAGGYGIPLPPT